MTRMLIIHRKHIIRRTFKKASTLKTKQIANRHQVTRGRTQVSTILNSIMEGGLARPPITTKINTTNKKSPADNTTVTTNTSIINPKQLANNSSAIQLNNSQPINEIKTETAPIKSLKIYDRIVVQWQTKTSQIKVSQKISR